MTCDLISPNHHLICSEVSLSIVVVYFSTEDYTDFLLACIDQHLDSVIQMSDWVMFDWQKWIGLG